MDVQVLLCNLKINKVTFLSDKQSASPTCVLSRVYDYMLESEFEMYVSPEHGSEAILDMHKEFADIVAKVEAVAV